LSAIHNDQAYHATNPATRREELQKARAAALKALELDDSLADAHAMLGSLRLVFDWDWTGAESSVERAIQLDPNSFEAHIAYVQYLMTMARFEEALRQCRRHQELDPHSAVNWNWIGMVSYRLGDYDRALEGWKKSRELVPGFWQIELWPAFALLQMGRNEEAVLAAGKAERLLLGDFEGLGNVGQVYARAGRKEDALRLLRKIHQQSRATAEGGLIALAVVYTGLGEKDEAFAWLEKAFQRRNPGLYGVRWHPWFDPLRGDPRFQDLLRRMNFPESSSASMEKQR
jgi:tetratricopeptide (TPR) repeat protein